MIKLIALSVNKILLVIYNSMESWGKCIKNRVNNLDNYKKVQSQRQETIVK